MGDLISRQGAIDEINKYILSFDAIDANFLDGLKTAIKLIKENLPSAQPEITLEQIKEYCRPRCLSIITNDLLYHLEQRQPKRTGEWLPDNNNYIYEQYVCSECKNSFKVDTCMGKPMWNFCPTCGCRMKEGE